MATNTNKIRDQIVFTGGLDNDSDSRFTAKGDWSQANNIMVGEDGEAGVVCNILGNKGYGTYTGEIVGGVSNEVNRLLYFFTKDSGSLYIYKYDDTDNSVTSLNGGTALPNYDTTNTTHVTANIIDHYIYYSDKYNSPKYVDIDNLGTSYYTDTDSTDVALPMHVGTNNFTTGASLTTSNAISLQAERINNSNGFNKIKDNIFAFRVQYVYEDNGRSVWSPTSNLVYPNTGNGSVTTNFDTIAIDFNSGDKRVSKINIAAKNVGLNSAWFQIVTIDKDEPVECYNTSDVSVSELSDDTGYRYYFYNDGYYLEVDQAEINKAQSDVPTKANTQEVISDNRLVYGGITTGYDPLPNSGDEKYDVDVSTFSVSGSFTSELEAYGGGLSFQNDGTYRFGISYIDKAGRRSLVNESKESIKVNETSLDIGMRFRIKHKPPSWAHYYQIYGTRRGGVTQNNVLYGKVKKAFALYPGTGTTQNVNIRKSTSFDSRNVDARIYNPTGRIALKIDPIDFPDFDFEKGDKITLVQDSDGISRSIEFTVKQVYNNDTIYSGWNYDKLTDGELTDGSASTSRDFSGTPLFKDLAKGKYDLVPTAFSVNEEEGTFLVIEPSTTVGFRLQDVVHSNSVNGKQSYLYDTLNGTYYQELIWNQSDSGGFENSIIKVQKIEEVESSPIDVQESLYYEVTPAIKILGQGTATPYHGSYSTETFSPIIVQEQTGYGIDNDAAVVMVEGFDIFVREITKSGTTFTGYSKSLSDDYDSFLNEYRRPNLAYSTEREDYYNWVVHGGKYFQDTEFNDISNFNISDRVELNDRYGDIQSLNYRGDTLKIYQDNKSSSVYIGKQETFNQDGTSNLIGTNKVLGTIRYSQNDYGTRYPVVNNNLNIYGFDINRGVVWRDSVNGIYPISGYGMAGGNMFNYKMHYYFKNKANELKESISNGNDVNVLFGYDDQYDNLYLTFIDNGTQETIIFSEKYNRWITNVDMESSSGDVPEKYFTLGQTFLSGLSNKVYVHNDTTVNRAYLYGDQKNSIIKFPSNYGVGEVKTYNSIGLHSDKAWEVQEITIPITQTYKFGMLSRIKSGKFTDQEGVLRAEFGRNILSNELYSGTVSSITSTQVDVTIADNGYALNDIFYLHDTTTGNNVEVELTARLGGVDTYDIIDTSNDLTDILTSGGTVILAPAINVLNGDLLRGYNVDIKLKNTSTDKVQLYKVDVDSELT